MGGPPGCARNGPRASPILLLQIEGQGQFQAHAHEASGLRIRMDRNAAMASSRSASRYLLLEPALSGTPGWQSQAQKKPHVRLIRMVRGSQGPQDLQGLGKPVALDERPRGLDPGVGRQVRRAECGRTPGPGHQTGSSR